MVQGWWRALRTGTGHRGTRLVLATDLVNVFGLSFLIFSMKGQNTA